MTYQDQINMRIQLAISIVLLNQEAENLGDYAVYLQQSAEILTYIVSYELEETDWRKMLKDVIPNDAYEEVEKIVFFAAVDYAMPLHSKKQKAFNPYDNDGIDPY